MKLVTHSEEFHTDDVFATALLLAIYPDAEVIRSRDDTVINDGDIVYDVGKIYNPSHGRFDHHQLEAGKRDNGIIYSAFGLLWKEYGVSYCGGDAEAAKMIEERLVVPIDANDNGQTIITLNYANVSPFDIDNIVSIYNPLAWLEDTEDYSVRFQKAVTLAQELLSRLLRSVQNTLLSQRYLLELYATQGDKRIIVTEKPVDSKDVLERCPELLYIVSRRPEKKWGVLAVSDAAGSYKPRRPFPEEWRGKPADDLPNITGVSDATFCHATGFYAVAASREGAIDLAKKALSYGS